MLDHDVVVFVQTTFAVHDQTVIAHEPFEHFQHVDRDEVFQSERQDVHIPRLFLLGSAL